MNKPVTVGWVLAVVFGYACITFFGLWGLLIAAPVLYLWDHYAERLG